MPIVMNMEWEQVTPQQYDAVRKLVNWEANKPTGGLLHIAYFSDKGLRVTDVWETADDFQNFVTTRLMPGVQQLGIPGEPRVEIHPMHALFTPAFQPV